MSRLIYITNISLDGYIEDETGAFDWVISEQVFEFITELVRPAGTYLYGRRLYETMAYWDAPEETYPTERREFARVWQKAKKLVFSRTNREFDPDAIRKLKRESAHDITIGGAELAAVALEADLIDEFHLFVHPIIVGGGKPAFQAGTQRKLGLLDMRRFSTGVIYLRYAYADES